MGTENFQGSLNEWLYHTGERVCQSGAGAVEIHQMYVDDLEGAGRLSGDSQVDLAVGVYVDDKPNGFDRAEPVKKRRGLFVVVGSDLVLVRDASWGRVKYEFYTVADLTVESLTLKLKGKAETPGVCLWSSNEGVWFALCPWYVGAPNMEQMQVVCNQMTELINEAHSKELGISNTPAPASSSLAGELRELVKFKDDGILTEDEFSDAKRKLFEN